MANGKQGDNPLSDLFLYGDHPFPLDMEAMLLRLHKLNPRALDALGVQPFDWESGKNLKQGRQLLERLLEQNLGNDSNKGAAGD